MTKCIFKNRLQYENDRSQAALGIEQTKKMKKFNLKELKMQVSQKLIARDLSKYFRKPKKYVNTYYTFH